MELSIRKTSPRSARIFDTPGRRGKSVSPASVRAPRAARRDEDTSKMKVAELRAELGARGLSTAGLKANLASRLAEQLAAEQPFESSPSKRPKSGSSSGAIPPASPPASARAISAAGERARARSHLPHRPGRPRRHRRLDPRDPTT